MVDWGLYSALRGTDDWQQKRQDKAMNLMAAEKMEKRAQEDLAQSAALEQGIQDYFNELQNLDVLPEDQERVRQEEKNARQSVIAGIAANNGDLKRYMSTGGISDVNNYKNAVMGSEAVKQAGVNKVNLQNYLTDRSKGNQRARFVDVDIPVIGPDGEPTGETESKKMKFEDQMKLYKAGKINKLNYNGSETRINVGIEDFSKLYKNPDEPYKSYSVTESDIYKKAMSKGASEEYARDIAKRYGQMYQEGGDAWKWNSKDPNELALKMAKLQQAEAKAKAKAAAESGRDTTATRTSNTIGEIKKMPAGTRLPSGKKDSEAIVSNLKFNKDKDGVYRPPVGFKVKDAMNPDYEYDMSLADEIIYGDYVSLPNEDGTTSRYLNATIKYPDPTSYAFGVFSLGGGFEDLPFKDLAGVTMPKDKSIQRNWQDDGGGNFTGDILIPIDDVINTDHIQMQMNKFIGTNQNADYTMGSVTNEDIQEYSNEEIMMLSEGLNKSPEEIIRLIQFNEQLNR